MVAIKSSFSESSSAGVRSVRSWIRTSCRRSLALSALLFLPKNRSKKLISFPPCQSLNARPNSILMIKIHERYCFTSQTFGDVSEGLAGPALRIKRDRCAAIGTDNDVFILRHNSNQLHSQQVEDILRRKHVMIFHQRWIQAIDDESGRSFFFSFQDADDPVRIAHR